MLSPVADLRTHEYPGFPTDLQALAVVFLSQTNGESRVFETIYEGRFKYVEDLNKIGANITVLNPREVSVQGPTLFEALAIGESGGAKGVEVCAHDIRAGFAVVMAALVGEGKFTVSNAHLIDRGYERLEERLRALGLTLKDYSDKLIMVNERINN